VLTQTAAIVDSSTLINLAATDLLGEVVRHISPNCYICRSIVEQECLYIRSADGAQVEELRPGQWIEDGIFSECEPSNAEGEIFVTYAASLDDGEAMCLALASSRQWALVIDDRKGQRFATELAVPVITTSAVMQHWANGKTHAEIAAALGKIEARARFRPAEDDPNYEWWMRSR
jgi:predicted nucleic acid-binding protein